MALFFTGELGMTKVLPEEAADTGVGAFEVDGVKEGTDEADAG
jgi:hypothetical protein